MRNSIEQICQRDNAFFKLHPHAATHRRRAYPDEIPRALRGLHIREVLVVWIADGIRLRGFIDAFGRVVGQGLDCDNPILTSAGGPELVKSLLQHVTTTFPLAAPVKKT
jgi:hypothetical protein